jgi:hypothetical protein
MTGERLLIPLPYDDLTVFVPTDPRWIYAGNRNPSDKMLPEYLAVGADKWEWPDMKEMFPNRPAPL